MSGLLVLMLGCLTPSVELPGRISAQSPPQGYAWDLPAGFPPPSVPADNPMSVEKVELGRRLFYDQRLSGNQTTSCASCHQQALAFTDGHARATGATGEEHPRSAMSLVNVAWSPRFNWADPDLDRLEDQVEVPMFNLAPVELGLAGREREVEQRLADDPDLRNRFDAAFPGDGSVTLDNVRKAIASFVRTIVSADSPWDRYAFWDEKEALSPEAQRGRDLFFSERTHCSTCHPAPLFAGGMRTAGAESSPAKFHNTGLYDVDGSGAYPAGNQGLIEHTGKPEDMGRFKAPTLRNVEVTAPYMHDGSIATLEEVIDFYADGGRGAGKSNPHKDPLITGFEISREEKADLAAFLRSLTDRSVLENPRFAAPEGSSQ